MGWDQIAQAGAKAITRYALGWLFVVLGILGFFLPVLQGWLFLGIGALLLAPYVPFFRRLRDWIYRKLPAVKRSIDRLKDRFHGKQQTEKGKLDHVE